MKKGFWFLLIFSCGVLTSSEVVYTPLQKRMLGDVNFIFDAFSVKYAPTQWKEKNFGWNLQDNISLLRQKIESKPTISLKEFQHELKGFFNSAKDYHVGVTFYSTECATLPFLVKKAEANYYISYVDREKLTDSSIEEGDQILFFNGQPIDTVMEEIKKGEVGKNTPETDQALAELILTHRCGSRGNIVPQGEVSIGLKKMGARTNTNLSLSWEYRPEKVTTPPKNIFPPKVQALELSKNSKLKNDSFFEKMMLFPETHLVDLKKGALHRHSLGAKQSFIPQLGRKVWESDENSAFDAYVFEMPEGYNIYSGTNIGYIRIPHYVADIEEVNDFKEIILLFRDNVDALIIDQINNPGGSVFYLYALASLLTDRPLRVPRHHIALTQQEVHMAATILTALEEVNDDASAKDILGEEIGGYPVDFTFSLTLKEFCQMLLDEWNAGNLYSKATPLFGVDEIVPNLEVGFNKPILILTNSLDFSGGDFFPAIMQDNKRATLFGTRTAGAGGYLISTEFPNRSGISRFSMTGSLAERINSEPIENLGVKPDIFYSLSQKDLQDNYSEYVYNILNALDGIVR